MVLRGKWSCDRLTAADVSGGTGAPFSMLGEALRKGDMGGNGSLMMP